MSISIIENNIALARTYLQAGKVVAIPTETVYGLAGSIEHETAIRKIYAMKQRPLGHPLIMHVASHWDLTTWVATIPDYVHILIEHFWPGPLTLVMQAKPHALNPLITGGQNTIAVRCPKHKLSQEILTAVNTPLVAPSANLFGKLSPTTAEHVRQNFPKEELLIIDGGRCPVGIESTILLATDPKSYSILRPGIIDAHDIASVIPQLEYIDPLKNSNIRVSGTLPNHYQPSKPLYCFPDVQEIRKFCQSTDKAVYVLTFTDYLSPSNQLYYQLPQCYKNAAFELYYQLRRADETAAAAYIAIELPPVHRHWTSIRERILKASNNSSLYA